MKKRQNRQAKEWTKEKEGNLSQNSGRKKKSCLNFKNCCCSCLVLALFLILIFLIALNAAGIWHIPGLDQIVWRDGPKPTREVRVKGRKIDPDLLLKEKFSKDFKKNRATADFSEEEVSLLLNNYLKEGAPANERMELGSGQIVFLKEEAEIFIRLEKPETALTFDFGVEKRGQKIYLLSKKIKVGKLTVPRFLFRILPQGLFSSQDLSQWGILDLQIKEREAEITVDPQEVRKYLEENNSRKSNQENRI